jgi:hypothetical protein
MATKRIDAVEKELILEAAGRLRGALCSQMRNMRIGGDLYREAQHLLEAIDRLAGRLTGDREYFIEKAPQV